MVQRLLREVRYFAIPLLLLSVTAALVGTGEMLKRPMGGRDIGHSLQALSVAAAADDWAATQTAMQRLDGDWQAMRRRLTFTVAAADLEGFDLEMAALRGAVEAEDPEEVRVVHRRLLTLWNDLTG